MESRKSYSLPDVYIRNYERLTFSYALEKLIEIRVASNRLGAHE